MSSHEQLPLDFSCGSRLKHINLSFIQQFGFMSLWEWFWVKYIWWFSFLCFWFIVIWILMFQNIWWICIYFHATLEKFIMMQHKFICNEIHNIGNREISKLLIIDPNDKCIRNDGRKSPNPNDIIKLYYGNPPQ